MTRKMNGKTTIQPHASLTGTHQIYQNNQRLVWFMGKKNPHPLLVGMSTGSVLMENNTDTSQKTNSILGIYTKDPKTLFQKSNCAYMFISELFTIAKNWKQPKYTKANYWIKNLSHIHDVAILGYKMKSCIFPLYRLN